MTCIHHQSYQWNLLQKETIEKKWLKTECWSKISSSGKSWESKLRQWPFLLPIIKCATVCQQKQVTLVLLKFNLVAEDKYGDRWIFKPKLRFQVFDWEKKEYKMAQNVCTKFTDNYELKEELGK